VPEACSSPTVRPLLGELRVPGDKSISHRALLVAALARGSSHIVGLADGTDVRNTRRILEQLGVDFSDRSDGLLVTPPEGGLTEASTVLDCGNSGTTMRLLCGALAAEEGSAVLTGDASLRARPMDRVIKPLRTMGATLDGRSDASRAPLFIRGGRLRMAQHDLEVASAQVKSALLFAGLRNGVAVREPAPSRDHTERMLRAAGIQVRRDPQGWLLIVGGGQPHGRDWHVPGDLSSAAFFLVAASLVPGSDLTLRNVGINPTRSGCIDVLLRMGANIEVQPKMDGGVEPRADIRVKHAPLKGVEIPPELALQGLDELPVLAIAAAFAEGTTHLSGAAELRVKESDRIARVIEGVRALGLEAVGHADGWTIEGGRPTGPARVNAAGDHRLAMAFAVARLITPGGVHLNGVNAVHSSYPRFFRDLASVTAA